MNGTHPLQPEEVMAYLDGEATPAEAREIAAHISGCESCQQLAAGLRDRSQQLREWRVGDPPASLVAPRSRRATGHNWIRALVGGLWSALAARPLLAAGSAAVLIVMAIGIQTKPKTGLSADSLRRSEMAASRELPETLVAAEGLAAAAPKTLQDRADAETFVQQTPTGQVETGPRIVRTATLHIVAADFDLIRPAVDRILQGVGGFIGEITASDRPGAARVIRGTLRLPSAQFSTALAQLRALGRVTQDSQNAEDVTTAVVDLDVRLTNARVTERRLNQVLQNRTGRVADVLEVEREIARVRTEIEQMTAQRTQLDRRIEYGTVTLEVVEERPAAVTLGTVPVPTRLRHAIADGVESAAMSMLDVMLFVLRAGPLLLLWATVLGVPAWLLVRRHAGRTAQRPGGV